MNIKTYLWNITMRFTGLLAFLVLGFGSTLFAQQWGDLSGTFVVGGANPAAVAAVVNKDVAYCGKYKLIDESLVVNPSNGGIRDVVVYIYVSRTGKKPAVHPDYEKTAKAEVFLDNKECRFEPHVLTLRTSQTLLVGNSDPIGHNTNVTTLSNPAQNVLVPSGGKLKLNFSSEERLPVGIACNIHPWMNAIMVVKDDPYVGISDADGNFTIKNLPVGKWTFQVWHKVPGYLSSVSVNNKATEWARGRVDVEIKPGMNQLGTIKVAPTVFKQ